MGTFKDTLHAAVLGYIREHCGCVDAVSVESIEDDTITRGVCSTCAYDEAVVRVFYTTAAGEWREEIIQEDYASLIRRLTDD
jgi:hypothetical protein